MAMNRSVLLDNIETEENDVNFADGLRDRKWSSSFLFYFSFFLFFFFFFLNCVTLSRLQH